MLENPHAIVNFAGITNRPQIRGDDIEDLSSASESEADVMIEEVQPLAESLKNLFDKCVPNVSLTNNRKKAGTVKT